MTTLELIIDFHLNSKRQGPGSEAETLKALAMTKLTGKRDLKLADLGCGTGGQTLTLAEKIDGQITAIDLFPEFLDELSSIIGKKGLEKKIKPLKASIDDLPFELNSLDGIWSEGAIYNIGFEKGIQLWKPFLKPGGYLAVTEITWITENRPKEIEDFWTAAYPEISRASVKIKQLEDHGYSIVGYFNLEPNSWLENYYQPIEDRFDNFLERHNHSDDAQAVVKEHQAEIELYQ
jgi:ubiquinone/menaquinone biosynthesis C-methylase UbiE